MSNITKIKISGTSYDIKDENACKVVELTQAQYDALPASAKTSNSLFVITDATAGDLSNYYTKSEADDLLDTKLDASAYTPTDLSNYYTKSETSGATEISTALNAKADTATTYTKTEVDNAITAGTSTKQDTLVSGTNIKTINNESILGEGNITIEGGGGGGKAIEAGRGISITTGETADTVSFSLPISAGTGTNSIKIGGGASSGMYSLAGGAANPESLNYASFAWGEGAEAKVSHSTVFGFYSEGNGYYSFANGEYVNTNNEAEHSQGKYNVSNKANGTWGDSGNTLFSVGNGTSSDSRHNAFEIRQNGDIYITKDGQDVKLQDQLGGGGGGSSYTAGEGIDITNDVISVTGKVDTSTYNTYTAATDTALASKQTTLTAGTGISIVDNVISATGGGGGSIDDNTQQLIATSLVDLNDRKIDASEVKANYQKKGDYVTTNTLNARLEEYETALDEQNVEEVTAYALNDLNTRFGGLKLTKITESEYAALTTKDENTLYIVVADPQTR